MGIYCMEEYGFLVVYSPSKAAQEVFEKQLISGKLF